MFEQNLTVISVILSSVTVIIVGVSAWLLGKQIKVDYEWNRTKTSQETLNNLVTGEFPDLRHKLEVELKCKIGDKSQTYEDRVKGLSEDKTDDFDCFLMRFLNILEAVAINIKKDIVDDDICYEYLGWIMTEYYRWSKTFIIKKRKKTGQPRILCYFEDCAQKWTKRIKEEKKE
jgi:hypothetical protein